MWGKGMRPDAPWTWKRSEKGGIDTRSRKPERERSKSKDGPDDVHDSVKLAKDKVGRVIGKQGRVINDIREKSGARIDAEDTLDSMTEFKIKGTPGQVERAKMLIIGRAEKEKTKPSRAIADVNQESSADATDTITDCVEFPAGMTGAIIGARGAKINEVRSQSGARIQVEKEADMCKVEITGSAEAVEKAKELLRKVVEERVSADEKQAEAEPEVKVFTDYVEFPGEMTGAIIGSRGAKVAEVRQTSGAKIHVEKTDDTCKVALTGTSAAVAKAKELLKKMAEEKVEDRPEGSGAEPKVVTDYVEFPVGMTGAIIGTRGAKVAEVRQHSGAKVQIEKADDTCKVVITGTRAAVDKAKLLVKRMADESDSQGGVRTMEAEDVTQIPQAMIGRVIGKGGETIQRLQKESGAKIEVNTTCGDPCPVRIYGSRYAVARGRYLLEEVVDRAYRDEARSQGKSSTGGRGTPPPQDAWGAGGNPAAAAAAAVAWDLASMDPVSAWSALYSSGNWAATAAAAAAAGGKGAATLWGSPPAGDGNSRPGHGSSERRGRQGESPTQPQLTAGPSSSSGTGGKTSKGEPGAEIDMDEL